MTPLYWEDHAYTLPVSQIIYRQNARWIVSCIRIMSHTRHRDCTWWAWMVVIGQSPLRKTDLWRRRQLIKMNCVCLCARKSVWVSVRKSACACICKCVWEGVRVCARVSCYVSGRMCVWASLSVDMCECASMWAFVSLNNIRYIYIYICLYVNKYLYRYLYRHIKRYIQ